MLRGAADRFDDEARMWQASPVDRKFEDNEQFATAINEVVEELRIQVRSLCWLSRQFTEIDQASEHPELDCAIALIVRAEQLIRVLKSG